MKYKHGQEERGLRREQLLLDVPSDRQVSIKKLIASKESGDGGGGRRAMTASCKCG